MIIKVKRNQNLLLFILETDQLKNALRKIILWARTGFRLAKSKPILVRTMGNLSLRKRLLNSTNKLIF